MRSSGTDRAAFFLLYNHRLQHLGLRLSKCVAYLRDLLAATSLAVSHHTHSIQGEILCLRLRFRDKTEFAARKRVYKRAFTAAREAHHDDMSLAQSCRRAVLIEQLLR